MRVRWYHVKRDYSTRRRQYSYLHKTIHIIPESSFSHPTNAPACLAARRIKRLAVVRTIHLAENLLAFEKQLACFVPFAPESPTIYRCCTWNWPHVWVVADHLDFRRKHRIPDLQTALTPKTMCHYAVQSFLHQVALCLVEPFQCYMLQM